MNVDLDSVADDSSMSDPASNLVTVSVVIPVYHAEDCLDELYRRLKSVLTQINPRFEIILVEDCSPDRSWTRIRELATVDHRVKGIQFSRNFGQHYAITAGIQASKGEWVVVMDCDLQDRPEEIPRLYAKALEGFDVVLARRQSRQDGWAKRTTSRAFYAVFQYLTELPYDGSVGNFRIISRQVADSFTAFKEQLRFFGGIVTWLGFRVSSIDVRHDPRFAGETTYTWPKLLNLAIHTILAYSDKPLRLAIKIGFSLSLAAFVGGVYIFVRAYFGGISVSGWASVMVSLYFLCGVMLGFMGIIGLYLGRVFDEVKERPLYVIREQTFAD